MVQGHAGDGGGARPETLAALWRHDGERCGGGGMWKTFGGEFGENHRKPLARRHGCFIVNGFRVATPRFTRNLTRQRQPVARWVSIRPGARAGRDATPSRQARLRGGSGRFPMRSGRSRYPLARAILSLSVLAMPASHAVSVTRGHVTRALWRQRLMRHVPWLDASH